MQLHYPDGTPFSPQDALGNFSSRMKALEAFAESYHTYPHDDDGHHLVSAVLAVASDFEEVEGVVGEWFDRLPEKPTTGGWGSDKPLNPRRSVEADHA